MSEGLFNSLALLVVVVIVALVWRGKVNRRNDINQKLYGITDRHDVSRQESAIQNERDEISRTFDREVAVLKKERPIPLEELDIRAWQKHPTAMYGAHSHIQTRAIQMLEEQCLSGNRYAILTVNDMAGRAVGRTLDLTDGALITEKRAMLDAFAEHFDISFDDITE